MLSGSYPLLNASSGSLKKIVFKLCEALFESIWGIYFIGVAWVLLAARMASKMDLSIMIICGRSLFR